MLTERLQTARACLKRAQDRQKTYADTKRAEVTFKVGDNVLLSTKNITLRAPGSKKLAPKYIGPFPVVAKINDVAYKLELPQGYRIHPVFHVSLLKPWRGNGTYQPPNPVAFDDEGHPLWAVESILRMRERATAGRTKIREFLVKWEGFGPEHDTWEPERELRRDLLISEMVDTFLSEQGVLRRNAKRQRT